MNSSDFDQGEDGAERVLRRANDDAGEIERPLLERLSDGQVERLVRSVSD